MQQLVIKTKDENGYLRIHFINLAAKQCFYDMKFFIKNIEAYPSQYLVETCVKDTNPLRM